jgi:hypothetical protein
MPWKLTRPEPPSGVTLGVVEDEGAPFTGGDGNIRDEMLADGLGDLSLIGVDQRRLK